MKRNNKLKTIPQWGPTYSVSFDIKVNSINPNTTLANVLHFSDFGRDCCEIGDRIPGIWITNESQVLISSSLNDKGNDIVQAEINLKSKFTIDIEQKQVMDLVRYH